MNLIKAHWTGGHKGVMGDRTALLLLIVATSSLAVEVRKDCNGEKQFSLLFSQEQGDQTAPRACAEDAQQPRLSTPQRYSVHCVCGLFPVV